MSKWIRRVVALLSMSTLLQFGGCGFGGLGDLFNFQRIVETVVAGSIFD